MAAEADMMTGAVEEDGEEEAVDIREDLNLLNLQNAMSPSTTTVSAYLINQKKWIFVSTESLSSQLLTRFNKMKLGIRRPIRTRAGCYETGTLGATL